MADADRVQRRERAAEVRADPGHFPGAQRATRADQLRQAPAADELHPDADAVAVAVGAEHTDDVRMAHPGQQPTFLDDCGREIGIRRCRGVQEFQRDLDIQVPVTCPKDVTEGTAPDSLQDLEVAPTRRDIVAPDRTSIVFSESE